MSANVITCDYMDEATGHDATEHAPHSPEPILGELVIYVDGDLERQGNVCRVCRHVVTDLLWHTDPRLDR